MREDRTMTRLLPLLALLAVAAGCPRRESQASRDFLNCVYHEQYEMGVPRALAEDACRRAR